MVQVPYGEGIANHTGPESCAVYREVSPLWVCARPNPEVVIGKHRALFRVADLLEVVVQLRSRFLRMLGLSVVTARHCYWYSVTGVLGINAEVQRQSLLRS